jgi:hypothetical protein
VAGEDAELRIKLTVSGQERLTSLVQQLQNARDLIGKGTFVGQLNKLSSALTALGQASLALRSVKADDVNRLVRAVEKLSSLSVSTGTLKRLENVFTTISSANIAKTAEDIGNMAKALDAAISKLRQLERTAKSAQVSTGITQLVSALAG